MKILLVKCHGKTIYSWAAPIITEPLELEYLSAMLKKQKVQHKIYDPILEGGRFEKVFQDYSPDVLLLSGYITAVDTIKGYARAAKEKNPQVKVLVGGVHAEINYHDFFISSIDLVVHSDGVNTLEKLIRCRLDLVQLKDLRGIAYRAKDNWVVNEPCYTTLETNPMPDRSYFNEHHQKTRYLDYSPIAIIKTALSCPHQCSFCYCKLLNGGHYTVREIDSVVEEIKQIESETIWIVDDSFLIDHKRVMNFIKALKSHGINKKFIAYSRVDFIVKHRELIKQLAEIGFVELIVGMEAVDDTKLTDFNKDTQALDNERASEILKEYGMKLTALFIADIDFTPADFKRLRSWIRKMKLESYTLSVFTPMKGTANFHEYEEHILNWEPQKWDFMHLVLKPHKMTTLGFYYQFYLVYLQQIFTSKIARRVVMNRLKNILSFGGRHG